MRRPRHIWFLPKRDIAPNDVVDFWKLSKGMPPPLHSGMELSRLLIVGQGFGVRLPLFTPLGCALLKPGKLIRCNFRWITALIFRRLGGLCFYDLAVIGPNGSCHL